MQLRPAATSEAFTGGFLQRRSCQRRGKHRGYEGTENTTRTIARQRFLTAGDSGLLPVGQCSEESLGPFDLLQGDAEGRREVGSTPPQVGRSVLIDAQLGAAHDEPV